MEFHVSRQARDRYEFDQSLFSFNGNIIFANFHAVRLFAQKINQRRDLVNFPERAVRAGDINALGLIDEILHNVIVQYHRQKNPQAMEMALEWVQGRMSEAVVNRSLASFLAEFPPLAVYRREMSIEDYLLAETDGRSNRAIALEEMLMLWVTNRNPAAGTYQELFDDTRLERESAYAGILRELYLFFNTQPRFGPDQLNLMDMLRAPALANPNSLTAQLEFIRENWTEMLGRYLYRLLSGLDLISEEQKMSFMGPGPVAIPIYGRGRGSAQGGTESADDEPERFSQDREWMPRVILLAKNSYVWLDQLSRKWKRSITRLDQIPDEELDQLSRWGFTGLWLIGLWERSQASAEIKRRMGNEDAVASAYSLWGYSIAADLGGDDAYQQLRDRAWKRGIRLASDMVPNHMGIDSPWVMEHPDWFIGLTYSPFPSYSFNGPDLSHDTRVGIFLEDHYYDRTDAAVVFKRVDRWSGEERFVYHGNDGTSMPWNDTAQLNYLNPEVREAIIQTILHVARMFPIIRFDAAMTLAKKHLQRLWFPEPGTGGAIPSRSDFSMTKEQFDALMPIEFWREVVDRAAVEAPDTLLLAEAFWLMEGYFVRTLGMHRVYNSAFMNLLRNEDNAKYREVIKNTIEFDPEILKRHVNFMNNPDERTAAEQFGKGDKYFGICVLLATMPGLPMFGHGQIEGFSEKYGMEFRRPLWDETPDPQLVDRHDHEIFPLLHRRAAFSGMDLFLLYDFYSTDNGVDENVFAYSNGLGSERNLVVYHNKFGSTRGWIRTSAAYMDKTTREMCQKTLAEGLNLQPGDNNFVIYRDQISGLEFLTPAQVMIEQGLFIDLGAYKYHVFMDFRQVQDDEYHSYQQLYAYLQGRGVPSIQDAMRELLLQPVQQPFRQIANPGYLEYLLSSRTALPGQLIPEAQNKLWALLQGINTITGANVGADALVEGTTRELEALFALPKLDTRYPMPGSKIYPQALEYLNEGLEDQRDAWLILFGYVFLRRLGRLSGSGQLPEQAISWMDEWQLGRILAEAYQAMSLDRDQSWRLVSTVRLLIAQQGWFDPLGRKPLPEILENWLTQSDIRTILGINRYQDTLWFNHEAFERFLW